VERTRLYVVLVPSDPLHNYGGHLNYLCHLYVICTSVRLNSVKRRLLPSNGVQLAATIQYVGVYIQSIDTYIVPYIVHYRIYMERHKKATKYLISQRLHF
jgi:hypothetical protein